MCKVQQLFHMPISHTSLRDIISEAAAGLVPFEGAGARFGHEREGAFHKHPSPDYAAQVVPAVLTWVRSQLEPDKILFTEALHEKLTSELVQVDRNTLLGISSAIQLTIRGFAYVPMNELSQAKIDTYQLTKIRNVIEGALAIR